MVEGSNEGKYRAYAAELLGLTSDTWKGVALTAGLAAGFFELLTTDAATSVDDLARPHAYDPVKVRAWIQFAESIGLVTTGPAGATLTEKGLLLTPGSPLHEVTAFVEETAFFLRAAGAATQTFLPHQSLDMLSDGKISRDYQPRVSDNLAMVIIDSLRSQRFAEGDTLLDVGCGSGKFLRELNRVFPGMDFLGVDRNLFALERGKRENLALGLADRITLLAGDIVEDLGDFADGSHDWVTAVNVLHFVPPDQRDILLDHLVRISRKGVFFNTVETQTSTINGAGNPLLHLLWNDFAGFYPPQAVHDLVDRLIRRFKTRELCIVPILRGNSRLVSILVR